MHGFQVHGVQTPLREIKSSLFIRLQNKASRGGHSVVKLAGGDVTSSFARDAGWSTRHVLPVAPPPAGDRPNIDNQMELLISKWNTILHPLNYLAPSKNRSFQLADNL